METFTSTGEAAAVVNHLKQLDIRFVAIDFDLTFVDLYTADRCQYNDVTDLRSSIRPFFLEFIPEALGQDLLVAIVTFSCHVDMIAELLKFTYGQHLAERITIRGNDRSWEYVGHGSRDGKQGHMASAAECLSRASGVALCRNTSVLIDDDADNVVIALENFVRAVHCDVKNPNKMVRDLLNLT